MKPERKKEDVKTQIITTDEFIVWRLDQMFDMMNDMKKKIDE